MADQTDGGQEPNDTGKAGSWGPQDSARLYGFNRWGDGHFSVDSEGYVVVHPQRDARVVRIIDVIEEARTMGLSLPLTIRFQDLLRHRVERLNEAFRTAIEEEGYPEPYRGVFPIKVNQLREVVEEILEGGAPFHHGLEAGSKPELLVALAMHRDPESLIICNGYKDDDYIRLALLGRKLGKPVILVVEQVSEVARILRIVKETAAEPLIGIRLKLEAEGAGKWAESSGSGAKFGLTAPELVNAARKFRRAGLGDALRLVHFHIGSQVPNILAIKAAVSEATRYFCELHGMGFPMGYLDVGGGLGVDYDGSNSNFESSINYSLEEYARDVVANVHAVCQSAGVPPPTLVSESGRAIVAAHSVLVVEAVDRVRRPDLSSLGRPPRKRNHRLVKQLRQLLENPEGYSPLERFHDAQQMRRDALSLFSLGYLKLEARAEAEALFWEICRQIESEERSRTHQPEELAGLRNLLADQYVCNFSVFQSLLDHWACDQLFPVAPLQRLDEEPRTPATLVDITCDSEGKIDSFIDLQEEDLPVLPLHELNAEPYCLGIFLVGAYQDIMGDLHNLFGRVGEVHVFLEEDADDGFYVEETLRGSRVNDLLQFVQHEGRALAASMKTAIDRATREDRVRPREGVRWMDFYEGMLDSTTYLVDSRPQKRTRRKLS